VRFNYGEIQGLLMSGVNAVDTLIFERNGKWWMLTTLDSADTGDCYSQLYLFHADSPASDRWTSHPKNPIIIDPDCGRNAGLLRDGERVFRVAQGQGFRQYGLPRGYLRYPRYRRRTTLKSIARPSLRLSRSASREPWAVA
jgi:hypothetical protein